MRMATFQSAQSEVSNSVQEIGFKGVCGIVEEKTYVHEPQIDVIRLQRRKRLVQSPFYIIRIVRVIPQFRRDKDFRARHA